MIDQVGSVLVLSRQRSIALVVWPANEDQQMPSFFQAHPWPGPELL
jgi:hypothetical protein